MEEEIGGTLPPKADSDPIHPYPATPPQNSYHGPTLTEVGTNAVNEGLSRSKIRCAAHLKILPFRWKLSILVTLTAFTLSTLVVNSCNFVSIKRVYTNDQITTYFGRGLMKGQLDPFDECKPWGEYQNLDVGARIEAARVGSVGCVVLGAILILLLMKDAFCDRCWITRCFSTRMWRRLKALICLLAAAFQALVQLLVFSHFCKRDSIEGEDDSGIYVQTCSTDTSSFGVSLAVICLYLVDFVLVALTNV